MNILTRFSRLNNSILKSNSINLVRSLTTSSFLSKMQSLPPLPAITPLTPRIIRILGSNPSKFTLQGTNTYLIGTGSPRILLDTGEGQKEWKENLKKVLEKEGVKVGVVLLTHWHRDHVGGVQDVRDLCGEEGVRVFKCGKEKGRVSGGNVEEILDGQVFEVEGARLRAVYSPGHTVDHMAFLFEEEGNAMFTGDNVLGHGTAVFEDLGRYLESLGRMREVVGVGARVYPGHGEVVEDGRGKIGEYVEHREQREREVLDVLRGDGEGKEEGWESMEIVRVVYKSYPEMYWKPAEGGVVQVLRKLEEEGRVREKGARWRLVEKAAL